MTNPISGMPTCERCRKEAPCIKVATATGERLLCIADCWRLWLQLSTEIKEQVADLLERRHADFFDSPTDPDISVLKKGKP